MELCQEQVFSGSHPTTITLEISDDDEEDDDFEPRARRMQRGQRGEVWRGDDDEARGRRLEARHVQRGFVSADGAQAFHRFAVWFGGLPHAHILVILKPEDKPRTAEDIDRGMELGYRHPMGPLKLTDLVGLDTRLKIAEYLHETLGSESFRPPELMREMVAQGKLGKKSGQGFYTW